MNSGSKNNTKVIKCQECNKSYVKKYISQHIKKMHPHIEYSLIIRRGMKYNFHKKQNLFKINQNQHYFCEICHKNINIKSKYMHLKSFLHITLSGLNKQKVASEKKPSREFSLYNNNIPPSLRSINKTSLSNNNNVNNLYVDEANNTKNEGDCSLLKLKDISNMTNSIIDFSFLQKSIIKDKDSKDFNFPLTIEKENNVSENESKSQMNYTRISSGLIPTNFIVHKSNEFIKDFSCENENENENIKSVSNNVYNSFDEESSSYNYNNFANKSFYYFKDADEIMIEQKVDEAIKKLLNKKQRNIKSKKKASK